MDYVGIEIRNSDMLSNWPWPFSAPSILNIVCVSYCLWDEVKYMSQWNNQGSSVCTVCLIIQTTVLEGYKSL